MVEGARLEIVYTLIAYRGFESLSLRHNKKGGFLTPFFIIVILRIRTPDKNICLSSTTSKTKLLPQQISFVTRCTLFSTTLHSYELLTKVLRPQGAY